MKKTVLSLWVVIVAVMFAAPASGFGVGNKAFLYQDGGGLDYRDN